LNSLDSLIYVLFVSDIILQLCKIRISAGLVFNFSVICGSETKTEVGYVGGAA